MNICGVRVEVESVDGNIYHIPIDATLFSDMRAALIGDGMDIVMALNDGMRAILQYHQGRLEQKKQLAGEDRV